MELLINMDALLEGCAELELNKLVEPSELLAGNPRGGEPARAEFQSLTDVIDFRDFSHRVDNLDAARADLAYQPIANQPRDSFAHRCGAYFQSSRDFSLAQSRVRSRGVEGGMKRNHAG